MEFIQIGCFIAIPKKSNTSDLLNRPEETDHDVPLAIGKQGGVEEARHHAVAARRGTAGNHVVDLRLHSRVKMETPSEPDTSESSQQYMNPVLE